MSDHDEDSKTGVAFRMDKSAIRTSSFPKAERAPKVLHIARLNGSIIGPSFLRGKMNGPKR